MIYYLLKVKGKAKIPDFIQLRDEDLTLIGYFRPGRNKQLEKIVNNPEHTAILLESLDKMQGYGKVFKVEF